MKRKRAHGSFGQLQNIHWIGAEVRRQGHSLSPPTEYPRPNFFDLHRTPILIELDNSICGRPLRSGIQESPPESQEKQSRETFRRARRRNRTRSRDPASIRQAGQTQPHPSPRQNRLVQQPSPPHSAEIDPSAPPSPASTTIAARNKRR